jgi:hypothetical protein
MYIGEYLNNPKLVELEKSAILNKENFALILEESSEMLFGKQLDPIVYSHIKRFDNGQIIGNKDLNEKGLHLFRYAFSTYAAQHRTKKKEFLDDGKVIVKNFLPEEHHSLIQQESKMFPISANKQGFNNCQQLSINNPGIDYCVNKSGMRELIMDCIGVDTSESNALYNENTFVQRVQNKPDDGDIQKHLHSDIFFPAVKWWYFPDEVTLDQGPFRFQKTKPQYNYNLWNWLYMQSINISSGKWERTKGKGHIEGSLRINDKELQEIGVEVEPVTVPKNTLVIANVQLFHGRGNTTSPHIRNAIHGSIRIKFPFIV